MAQDMSTAYTDLAYMGGTKDGRDDPDRRASGGAVRRRCTSLARSRSGTVRSG